MIAGMIFDADGTLIDSMSIWAGLGEKYLSTRGIKAEEGLSELLYPMSLEESSAYLKEKYGLTDSAERIKSDTILLAEKLCLNEVRAKEGAEEFLRAVRKLGVLLGIATMGNGALLEKLLTKLNLKKYFSVMMTCTELETTKKEAKIYLRTAEALGTSPCETVVFEDMLCGLRSAKGAGFVTVGVEDEFNKEERAEIVKTSDLYIRDFNDAKLKELIRSRL